MPTHVNHACPGLEQFQRMVSGELPDAEKEGLLRHLEQCDACADRIRSLPEPDTVVGLLRHAATVTDPCSDAALARLVERLSQLRPDAPSPEMTVDHAPRGVENAEWIRVLAPAQSPDELGRLGPYRVLQVLGTGGMGVVFRAEDPQLARPVALKAMLPGTHASESARQRFLREARAAAAIKHDNIVTIYQVGEDRGVPFLAMELLEGEPLDVRLQREGKLPVTEVIRIGRETALGLAAAHQRGMIHRDIKPANIWLETLPGVSAPRARILDFGLARTGTDAQITQEGLIVGTPAYMAPEQGQGRPLDARADLFSLGCVLYRLATGGPPFKGTDIVSTLMAVSTHNPPPPHELDPSLPTPLSRLIMGLLAKEPADRPASAAAVAESLERIACETSGPVPAPVLPPRSTRWGFIAIAASLLLAVVAGLWAAGVVRLKIDEGVIVIEGLPEDAEVLVDGVVARVKYGPDRKSLEISGAPGERKLLIKAPGFEAKTADVTLRSGDRTPIHIRLEPTGQAVLEPARPRPGKRPTIPAPSRALEARRRSQIPPEALTLAGGGDPKKAPASLVAVLGDVQPLHQDVVSSLAYSPDGHWLASASHDRTIILRDARTGKIERVLRGHAAPIVSIVFSKDGETLVSASRDGTLRFWPVAKEAEPEVRKLDLGEIVAMTLSSDGKMLAVGGSQKTIQLWKWGAWEKPLQSLTVSDRIDRLALSSDGELLAVGVIGMRHAKGEETKQAPVMVYQTSEMKLRWTLPSTAGWKPEWKYPMGLTFSPDGKFLYGTGLATGIKRWDMATGKLLYEHKDVQGTWAIPAAPTLTADGKRLAFSKGTVLNIVSNDNPEKMSWLRPPIYVQGDPHSVEAMAFRPDGAQLAVGTTDGNVLIWQPNTWKQPFLDNMRGSVIKGLAVSPDGKALLTTGDDNTLRRWTLEPWGKSKVVFEETDLVRTVLYSPDGKRFVTSHGWEWWNHRRRQVMWDAGTDKELFVPQQPVFGASMAFSADGKLFAAGGDNRVQLWNTEDGRKLHQFEMKGGACSLAFSADGKHLTASAARSKTIWLWEVATGKEVRCWESESPAGFWQNGLSQLNAAAFHPSGEWLATGHSDGTITLWSVRTGQKKHNLGGHAQQVNQLKFTPDGLTLVSCSDDGTLRLWNLEQTRAREIISLGRVNQPMVFDLDPSGRYLFAAGQGTLIYVLRLPEG